jgi:class 3 adenylate cyclase/HAMP domain-containing protein
VASDMRGRDSGRVVQEIAAVALARDRDTTPDRDPKPERIRWLLPLVLLVNLAVLGLLMEYSSLNLLPDLPTTETAGAQIYHVRIASVVIVVFPTMASVIFLWPVLRWFRRRGGLQRGGLVDALPSRVAERGLNAPIALAAFSLLSWLLVGALALVRSVINLPEIPLGVRAHLVIRPLFAGLIAGGMIFFTAGGLCRTHVWPVVLARTRIAGNLRLWRYRVSQRLFALWLLISFLPLSIVTLTAFAQMDGGGLPVDPRLGRLVPVILLIASSAAVGGAWLAWIVSCCVGRPLKRLEVAMARLRDGDLDTREPVSATDEIGALAEGFNLMADRLSQSHAALEARNRELAEALDRVLFLEHVKRSLDRFVPETVRHAIEENPEAAILAKTAKDVTVLFLDIEDYTRLSEALPRPQLNAVVERYFSLFLAPIRAEGGDINETAGDGLMIVFQAESPSAHALAAVRAALAIREQTALANHDTRGMHPPIRVNMGISSGECDVGTTRFGGPAGERWTFTASGPVTNLAARLGDRAVKGQILLSPETARRVSGQFQLRSLGALSLKNLGKPVEAWEVVSESSGVGDDAATVRARETGGSATVKQT